MLPDPDIVNDEVGTVEEVLPPLAFALDPVVTFGELGKADDEFVL